MKVFSVRRFIEDCRSDGETDKHILGAIENWALKCEGMTEEQLDLEGVPDDAAWMTDRVIEPFEKPMLVCMDRNGAVADITGESIFQLEELKAYLINKGNFVVWKGGNDARR